MMDQEITLPRTKCPNNKVVACDDYLKLDKEGNTIKDFRCCNKCGWNPAVDYRRRCELRYKRGMAINA